MEQNYVLDTKGANLLRVITTPEEMGRLMTCLKGMDTCGWESEVTCVRNAQFSVIVESLADPPCEPYNRIFTQPDQNLEVVEYIIGLKRSHVKYRVYQVVQTEELELDPGQLRVKKGVTE